jgi:hypothetical protein
MEWRGRLRELARAGGMAAMAVAVSGCMPGGCCNANPDPCCSAPNSQACAESRAPDLSVPAPPDLAVPLDLTVVHDVGAGD